MDVLFVIRAKDSERKPIALARVQLSLLDFLYGCAARARSRDAVSRSAAFEKAGETFTRLRRYSSRTNSALDTKNPSGVKEMESLSARSSWGGHFFAL